MKKCLLMFGFLVLAILLAAMLNERTQFNPEETFDANDSKTELLLAKSQNEE